MELRHHRFARITIAPQRCFGKPCIRDLRISVTPLLAFLGSGHSIDELLREWPELQPEDVHQALAFAAAAMDERLVPLVEAAIG